MQWHDSLNCVCVCVCIPFPILFHYNLSQDIVYNSARQCICKLDEPFAKLQFMKQWSHSLLCEKHLTSNNLRTFWILNNKILKVSALGPQSSGPDSVF